MQYSSIYFGYFGHRDFFCSWCRTAVCIVFPSQVCLACWTLNCVCVNYYSSTVCILMMETQKQNLKFSVTLRPSSISLSRRPSRAHMKGVARAPDRYIYIYIDKVESQQTDTPTKARLPCVDYMHTTRRVAASFFSVCGLSHLHAVSQKKE